MKLSRRQFNVLDKLRDGKSHEVMAIWSGFTGKGYKSGSSKDTLEALKTEGYIVTETDLSREARGGYTRQGAVVYATITLAGRAALNVYDYEQERE